MAMSIKSAFFFHNKHGGAHHLGFAQGLLCGRNGRNKVAKGVRQ